MIVQDNCLRSLEILACHFSSGKIPQQNRPILTTTGKRVPIRAESNAVYPARMPGECTRVVSRCGIP